jgi:hypothetical protein
MPLTIAGIVQDMTTSSNSWPPGWTESG